MWKRLRAIFFSGLIAILPLGFTIFVFQILYQLVSGSFGAGGILGYTIRALFGSVTLPDLAINIMVILITILVILLVGAVIRVYAGRVLYATVERVILSIPIFRKIYSATKQLIDAFFNRDFSTFKRVVLVEYPSKGFYMLGFETNKEVPGVEEAVGEKLISVFIMSPPNPITGIWLIVPERKAVYLDHITIEEGFQMVMSLGISVPAELRSRLLQQRNLQMGSQGLS